MGLPVLTEGLQLGASQTVLLVRQHEEFYCVLFLGSLGECSRTTTQEYQKPTIEHPNRRGPKTEAQSHKVGEWSEKTVQRNKMFKMDLLLLASAVMVKKGSC